MNSKFIDSQNFKGINFTHNGLELADYEYCNFINCDFSNLDLSEISFSECEFEDCNLSSVILNSTSFKEVIFKNCKLLGMQFDKCNPMLFSIDFDDCQLNLSSFYDMELKNTKFKRCALHEVDFVEADLTGLKLEQCDLKDALFENTILRKTDFRTSFNYSIDPELNRIAKAKFSLPEIKGLLHKYDIEIE